MFRKYNQRTGEFSNADTDVVEWVSQGQETVGNRRSLKVVFRIQDDGPGDEYTTEADGRGLIYDPIGPALRTESALSVAKGVSRKTASVGDIVQFRIRVNNYTAHTIRNVTIKDYLPAGFKLLPNTVRKLEPITGRTTELKYSGRRVISIPGFNLPPESTTTLTYSTVLGSSVTLGEKTNRAQAFSSFGSPLSNEAKARVEVVVDPLFGVSTIIGKVFNDINGNGKQDQGEKGIGKAKIATVSGEWITTDEHGRYSYSVLDPVNSFFGSNFILKLDLQSLPKGAKLTTDNPAVERITEGALHKINFGIAF